MSSERFQYGGQALIEGVMMRGKKIVAIAIRKTNNEIVVEKWPLNSFINKYGVFKLPLIRGILMLFQSLALGVSALSYSANQVAEEEDVQLSNFHIAITMAAGFGLAIMLFIVLPAFLVRIAQDSFSSAVTTNIAEGLIRILVFITYIIVVSRLKDIQRVFQYHGAEHKVIYSYESGRELTVDNAKNFSTLHPRCGTAFLLVVMVISIILFSFLGHQTLLMRIVSRILLLPLVAGISYEVIKAAGKKDAPVIFKWLTYPGLLLQKLTTREPDDDQIDVAICALQKVLESENNVEVASQR